MAEMPYAIGFDLGGSILKTVAVQQSGRVLHQAHAATLDPEDEAVRSLPPWTGKVLELLQNLEARFGAPAPVVGLSAPGLVALDGRSIAHMPGRLRGLEGLDWTQQLQREQKVPVLNDAHAALLGECWLGAGQGLDHVLLLTLGTGVGGAILCEGRLMRGAIGRAGHLGHMTLDPRGEPDITGMPGTLEQAIGEITIRERSDGRFRSTRELVQAHLQGDLHASQVWLDSVYTLACAVGSLINLIDPQAVIIGGGISQAGEALFEPLGLYLDQVAWRPGGMRVAVHPARLGEFAGALGAARHAIEAADGL